MVLGTKLQQLENSLRRLQTDDVDIYWFHSWDGTSPAPIEETMRALEDIVASGKARYIGFSDIPAWKTAEHPSRPVVFRVVGMRAATGPTR